MHKLLILLLAEIAFPTTVNDEKIEMTKILFFCSPIGLGHATRDLAIINQMELESQKIFSGSSAIQFFQRNDIEANDVYSPPKFEVQNGKLEKSLKWLWSYYKYYKNCKEISNDIIRKEEPDLIISDEDFASIAVAQERGIRNIVITDILETKFTTGFGAMVEKKINKTMQEMLQKANRVIIPESGMNQDNIIDYTSLAILKMKILKKVNMFFTKHIKQLIQVPSIKFLTTSG